MAKLNRYVLLFFIISITFSYNWDPVDDVLNDNIGKGSFAGATLRIANSTHIIYSKQYGFLMRQVGQGLKVNKQTIYDIASLSKVTGTLGVIQYLADIGKLNVNQKVMAYIPQFGNNGKQQVLVKNLLLHNAGLLPDYPGNAPDNKQQVMNFSYNCVLDYPCGTKYVYSDLSFILLGQIAQRITGQKLDKLVKDNLNRMGIFNTGYLPSSDLIYRIAPTQYNAKRGLIRGVVHDPTCYAFGGVAGHAGIFAIANDLVRYMQVHISGGKTPQGNVMYNRSTIQTFWKKQQNLPYENSRALGWDTIAIQDNPPSGHYFSENSFGHTGFTGTSMWADVKKDLIIVLLTNRVHPTSADSSSTVKARADVSDAVVKVMGF